MTTDIPRATAGLVFLGHRQFDIVRLGNRLSSMVETIGHRVTGLRILSGDGAQLSTGRFDIRLDAQHDCEVPTLSHRAPSYLSVSVIWHDAPGPDDPPAEAVLAHALKALHGATVADYVRWLDTGALLDSADFVMATATGPIPAPHPRPTGRHKRPAPVCRLAAPSAAMAQAVAGRCGAGLPDVEETNAVLQARLQDCEGAAPQQILSQQLRSVFSADTVADDPAQASGAGREPTALRCLSAWSLAIAVSIFALPIGAALMVVTLLRGENLRLAAQTTALTGTFIGLQSMGATAGALKVVQGFLA